ncbi:MAG: hypothetical protein KatS3mg003_2042 [Candidatus Nitrosocaldaceae archaeon]|nr:MAG: hypothetical protein KatS3mg003_2042 [Candidatus Nitrosocaldaceae archaeon]
MSSILYKNASIGNADSCGLLGFAYKYDDKQENIFELQWVRTNNGKYKVLSKSGINDIKMHHTLDPNAKDYTTNTISLSKVLNSE